MTQELRRICQRLEPLIGESATALWIHYQLAETPAARQEAENTIQTMAVAYLGSAPSEDVIRLPPAKTVTLAGPLNLGNVLYPGTSATPLGVHPKELTRHMGIFATTGAGKTNLCIHLLKQFQQTGIPFMVIDWKRSYRRLQSLPDMDGLRVYTVGRPKVPFTWNPLRPPPGVHHQTWVQILCEILEKSHVAGQGVADVLDEHAETEFENREFTKRGPNEGEYPNFFDLKSRVERHRFTGRRALWRDSCLRVLRTFTTGPAADTFNSRQPLKLETLLTQPVVLELDLELPKTVRTFFSEVIIRWVHLYRLGVGEKAELQHVFVLEEAHNVFPKITSPGVVDGLESVYREIRSFGQGLVAITQHPSLLPIYVLGNTHVLVFMMLTHEADVRAAQQALLLERGEERYLDQLRVGEAIVKIKGRVPALHVGVPEMKLPALSTLRGERK